jgi:hypothetical protein
MFFPNQFFPIYAQVTSIVEKVEPNVQLDTVFDDKEWLDTRLAKLSERMSGLIEELKSRNEEALVGACEDLSTLWNSFAKNLTQKVIAKEKAADDFLLQAAKISTVVTELRSRKEKVVEASDAETSVSFDPYVQVNFDKLNTEFEAYCKSESQKLHDKFTKEQENGEKFISVVVDSLKMQVKDVLKTHSDARVIYKSCIARVTLPDEEKEKIAGSLGDTSADSEEVLKNSIFTRFMELTKAVFEKAEKFERKKGGLFKEFFLLKHQLHNKVFGEKIADEATRSSEKIFALEAFFKLLFISLAKGKKNPGEFFLFEDPAIADCVNQLLPVVEQLTNKSIEDLIFSEEKVSEIEKKLNEIVTNASQTVRKFADEPSSALKNYTVFMKLLEECKATVISKNDELIAILEPVLAEELKDTILQALVDSSNDDESDSDDDALELGPETLVSDAVAEVGEIERQAAQSTVRNNVDESVNGNQAVADNSDESNDEEISPNEFYLGFLKMLSKFEKRFVKEDEGDKNESKSSGGSAGSFSSSLSSL